MKKNLFFAYFFVLTSGIFAQTLDTTIGLAATGVSGNLPRNSTVVMIEFETTSEDLANHVIDDMNHNLVTLGLIKPVERRRLNTIRSELALNMRGEVGDDFAQRIGHMLGTQYIILGSISPVGNQYALRFRAITTETATIVWSFSQNIRSDSVLDNLLRAGGSGVADSGSTVVPVVTTYKVGDRGPAGGIIFYDKGNDSGGWRYLEAATEDLGRAQWGRRIVTGATASEIGTGNRNTRILTGYTEGKAAQLCQQYSQGGFNDWYLPSKDELNWMYTNLERRGLGNFNLSGFYWSSTEINQNCAGMQRFSDGFQQGGTNPFSTNNGKDESHFVRPIRQF